MTASAEWRAVATEVKDWDADVDPTFDANKVIDEGIARLDAILHEEIKVHPDNYPRDGNGKPIPPPPSFQRREPTRKRKTHGKR